MFAVPNDRNCYGAGIKRTAGGGTRSNTSRMPACQHRVFRSIAGGMLPVTDPRNIFSEITQEKVSPAVAEDLPRICA